jgi:hypothetical protein
MVGEEHLVERSLHPPVELEPGLPGYRRVEKGRLRPRLEELAVERADELPIALAAWQRAAETLVDDGGWLEIESVDAALARLEQVKQGANLATLPIGDAWALANAPVDAQSDSGMLRACAAAVADGSLNGRLRRLLGSDTVELTLAETEQLARQASILRWFANTFPRVKGLTAEAARLLEERADARAGELLAAELRDTTFGRCAGCGGAAAPWFTHCDSCHRSSRHGA